MVLPTMFTINRYKTPSRQPEILLKLDMFNRLHHLYMPTDIINLLDTWHLEHKYPQLSNLTAYSYYKYILQLLALAPPWFNMNKKSFWTQEQVYT